MRDVKVKFSYDLTDFEQKANAAAKEIREESLDTVKYCTNVFANAAAKYTPPSIGKSSIEKKYYERPYLVLIRLIRGGYGRHRATEEDVEQFKNGMVYKVLDTRNGHTKTFAYCKTKGQLKQLRRIANRGLSRVMWGKNLEDIDVKIPAVITRLIGKSPNLDKINLNENKLINDVDVVGVEIENQVANVERYAKFAEKKGYDKVRSALAVRLRVIAEKHRKL